MSTTRATSRKHRGYKTQRNVALYLKRWFPYAQSNGAGAQGTDVLNTPFDIEVKARDRVGLKELLAQMEARLQKKPYIGILRLNGMGDDASQYIVVTRLDVFMESVVRCSCTGNYVAIDNECSICGKWHSVAETSDTKDN